VNAAKATAYSVSLARRRERPPSGLRGPASAHARPPLCFHSLFMPPGHGGAAPKPTAVVVRGKWRRRKRLAIASGSGRGRGGALVVAIASGSGSGLSARSDD
jgi:hypothetical protein